MTAADPTAVDTTDPRFIADPYPVFRELRDRHPLHEHTGWGAHVAVSHEACSAILRHRGLARVWRDAEPAADFTAFNALHRLNMLENEQQHERFRAAFAPLFQPRRVESLRAMITRIATGYFDELRAQLDQHGSADLMAVLARPLPVDVVTTLLGFPPEDRGRLREWSNSIVRMYEPGVTGPSRAAAEQAAQAFRDYAAELIGHRRRHPADDYLGHLLDIDSALSAEEFVANYVLLLMAGHEASVNGLGNAVVALHEHPGQWLLLRERLRASESALRTAVDELLRYDTPNQMFERTAVRPVSLGAHHIDEGEKVVVLLGSANRDPAAFHEPDRLDLTRTPNPHLALGAGVHYCLGAPLARLEIGVALAVLAERMPDYRLIAPPDRLPGFAIRGFDRLDVAG